MLAEPVRSDSDLKGWFATDSGGNLPGDGEGTKPPTDEIGVLEKLHQDLIRKQQTIPIHGIAEDLI